MRPHHFATAFAFDNRDPSNVILRVHRDAARPFRGRETFVISRFLTTLINL
jgi:hypothetical protein